MSNKSKSFSPAEEVSIPGITGWQESEQTLTANTVDAIATLCDHLEDRDLSSPESTKALAELFETRGFRQLLVALRVA